MTAQRCPFCHDAIAHERGDVVTCVGCGADHHAECFLESEGCATACRVSTARVGAAEVSLSVLSEVVAGDRLAALAAMPAPPLRGRASALLLGVLLSLVLAFLAAPVVGGLLWELGYFRRGSMGLVVGAACGAVLGLVTTWLLVRGRAQAPRLKLSLGATEGFDAILGQWRTDPHAVGVPPDPLGPVREWIDEGPAPASPVGPTPDVCPWCEEALEADDEDPLSYCYHCGGQLGDIPRAPEKGETVEGETVEGEAAEGEPAEGESPTRPPDTRGTRERGRG